MTDIRQGPGASAARAATASDPEKTREAAVDPLIGRVVGGRFKILSVIARGGMGKVYRAEQAPLGRVCALKVLSPKYDGDRDPEFQRRFLLEASTAAKLTHPNTVTIFDYGQEGDDLYYIAMEYIEGRTLHRVLREEAPLSEQRVALIAAQICRSLREAHQLGVVHRDLKPGNVLLTDKADEHDVVKVLDFGLVKDVTGEAEDLTQAGLFMGSPKYMAPEQILGTEISPRTDIYSLGVMMYEMLCGKVPFDRGASVGTLMAHVNEPPPPMQANNPSISISASMEVIVKKCLEKAADDRYPTMKSLLEALKRVGTGIFDTNEGLPAAYLGRTPSNPPLLESGSGPLVRAAASPSFTPPSHSNLGAVSSSGAHPAPIFASPSISETLGAAPDRSQIADVQPKPKRALMWAGLVGVAALGVFGFLLTRPSANGGDQHGAASASTATPTAAPPASSPGSTAATAAPTPTEQAAPKPTAAAGPRRIRVETDPPGAQVTEDGVERCNATPCELVYEGSAASAPHALKVSKKGLKPTKADVAPSATSVSVKLEGFSNPTGGAVPVGKPAGGKNPPDYKPSPY